MELSTYAVPRMWRSASVTDRSPTAERQPCAQTVERWFVVLALVLFAQAFLLFLYDDPDSVLDPSETRPLNQAIFVLIYLGTAIVSFRQRAVILKAIWKCPWLWLLVGVATLSISWSAVPEATSRRSVALIATTLFGAYLGSRYTLREQLQLLLEASMLIGVGSILSAVFLPEYGLMQATHLGAWRGVFGEKNSLGRFATLCLVAIAASYGDAVRPGRLWYLRVLVTICAVLLATSHSATALIVVAFLGLLWPLIRSLRRRRTHLVSILAFAAVVGVGLAALSTQNLDSILNSLGRDATLTGRTALWEAVLEEIRDRPLLGYGFGGFWLGWNGPSADVWQSVGFATPHSHNGLLDLLLDIGGVGTTLFLVGYCVAVKKAVARVRLGNSSVDMWPIGFLAFMLFYNVTESAVLRQNNLYWVIYVSIVLMPRLNGVVDYDRQPVCGWVLRRGRRIRPSVIAP